MKLDNVKPLDIDAILGTTQNKIPLIGIELEGAWTKLPEGINQLEEDGSVFNRRMPAGANFIGELPIGPMMRAAFPKQLIKHHPSHVDKTCGMHVHMSFENLWQYQLLMVPEYPATVTEYLKRWAKANGFADDHYIWERLNGQCKYCVNEFYPDLQASTKTKGHAMGVAGQRYTAIHYCGRQNTIECRVLPMMTRTSLAISAIQQLLNVTNACLYVLGKKRTKCKGDVKVTLPSNMVYEETLTEFIQ